jgi:predicted dehydrogenase
MKIGLMSFAHPHAESYIQLLQMMPEVEVTGIADDDEGRGKHYAKQFNTHYFDSYEALLAERPDGVVVCSENAKHRALVELAARAGAHVLCEKPLATSVEDAQAMLDACEKAGKKLMTAFPMRYSAPIGEISRLISHKGLGKIYAVNGTNQGVCPKHLRAWFVDKQLAGGGAITDHVVHVADLLRWILDSEVSEVFAEVNRILHADESEVETGGLVMLTFANGTIATVDCSWSKPDYYPTGSGLTLGFVGEKGLVTVNAGKQVLTVYSDARQRPQFEYWGSSANQGMLWDFIETIEEGYGPLAKGYDGYKAVEIVAAAYRSVESGQPVKIG